MQAVTSEALAETVGVASSHANGYLNGNERATDDVRDLVLEKARRAQIAGTQLRTVSTAVKNSALHLMAEKLVARSAEIIAANEKDIATGRERGLSEAMLDRLRLNEKRIGDMADGCRQVAALPDPIGQVIGGGLRPNGMRVEQVRVPLGVIGIIYESRPNVTVDAAILCLKSGNAVILRGGSEAIHSNLCLAQIIEEAAREAGAPANCIQLIETTDRAATNHLAQMNGLVDLIIPRGGEGLKKALSKIATVPMIFAAGGICHIFVDESADAKEAAEIVFNAKVQRPSTCNALETLLVHKSNAAQILPAIAERLRAANVELRGDDATRAMVPMKEAADEDWDTEYGTLILSIAVVDDLDVALSHIARHGTGHSDSILTQNYANAEKFVAQVDSAAVYVNASTRFTDGFEFGLGAEVGISTQKLHARGPMGLEALTSTKFVVRGDGQVRQ